MESARLSSHCHAPESVPDFTLWCRNPATRSRRAFPVKYWGPQEIFITENGCATNDVLDDDGTVYDTDCIMFLRAYLTQLQRATADGVPVKGYFQWSLMDNFEWWAGFGNRFGLLYVDFKTQKAYA
jgi:beta-glucosidase